MAEAAAAAKMALIRGSFDPDKPCRHEAEPCCYICGGFACQTQLLRIFGKPMCRDRFDCYQRYKGLPA